MQREIDRVQIVAKELEKLEKSDKDLFDYLNSKPKEEIEELIDNLSEKIAQFSPTLFQPVNLLRYDVLNLVKEGVQMTAERVEAIKTLIIERDVEYFSKYGEGVIEALKSYQEKKKSPFATWKRYFSIFYNFYYGQQEESKLKSALEIIAYEVKETLDLKDYKAHIVDFNGPQNFGTTYSWIAFYPENCRSHREAYQLFLQIEAHKLKAGVLAGYDIPKKGSNTLEEFNTIEEAITKLRGSIEIVEEKNSKIEKSLDYLEEEKRALLSSKSLPKESKPQNFWWLNANPTIWRIDSYKLEEVQSYTTYNDKGNKRRIYRYFEEAKPGDLVIGYESSPVKQIKAIIEITEGLHLDHNGEEIISFKIKEIVKEPISWDELKETKGLEECEVFINNQGSLFSLTADQFEIIRDLIDERNITLEKEEEKVKIKEYSFLEDPDKPFLEKREVEDIVRSLEVKKNIVLQGPPGVGKTFIAKKIAYEMMKETDDTKITMIQFHQSYAYEDFIQGIRPVEQGFRVKNGIFYNFCKKAELEPDKKFFFIIDEINRGNLSKIFGELMMLIESDKRGKESLPLTYSDKDDLPFSVPENLYLIGTMNTADRSLAIVDYALRRRFRFIMLKPKFNYLFKEFISSKTGVSREFAEKITRKINALNETIKGDKNLGSGFLIGHSFFCNPNSQDEKKWFENIVKFELKPLLEEYWFDDLEKVENAIKELLQ